MRILIVRTSSLGDLIHTFPAINEAVRHVPEITFDWVVEKSFAEIPTWHSHVARVIPIELRQWRRHPIQAWQEKKWQNFYEQLRLEEYDAVIDAQGLIKSAVISRLAKTKNTNNTYRGFHWRSAREALAGIFYQRTALVAKRMPAVLRNKYLFACVLDYTTDVKDVNYRFDTHEFPEPTVPPGIVFLHSTTWLTKHWPTEYWKKLAELASKANLPIYLPWHSDAEKENAERIAENLSHVSLLPKQSLTSIASIIQDAKAVVTVDTGLGHVAAALNKPTIFLYGATDSFLTCHYGKHVTCLTTQFTCSPCQTRTCHFPDKKMTTVSPPCFSTLLPEIVWQKLKTALKSQ